MAEAGSRRVVRVAALAALAIGVSACGGPQPVMGRPEPTPNSQAAVPTSESGVTTARNVFGPACNQQPQTSSPGTGFAAISADPQLTQLAFALRKANLVDLVNNAPGLTIIAPNDAAFRSYQRSVGEEQYKALLGQPAQLAEMLEYLLVARRYDRHGLATASQVATLQGGTISIRDAGQTLEITDNASTTARVLCGNIPATNATLFIVDQVLRPDLTHASPSTAGG
jgi:uncharacterized surface protein with fasciclin (FAS1) repeats